MEREVPRPAASTPAPVLRLMPVSVLRVILVSGRERTRALGRFIQALADRRQGAPGRAGGPAISAPLARRQSEPALVVGRERIQAPARRRIMLSEAIPPGITASLAPAPVTVLSTRRRLTCITRRWLAAIPSTWREPVIIPVTT